ncbi:sensor histidine kinase [Methylotenera sp. N17]|uniref:sensor histidine kinase n=1 Tax=Methylotenera sp. N17 TaxID=1502761 RepID=UPI0009DDA7AE|nr:DUF4118 domain-containing protein [Methylotenera sp. N17]
MKPHPRLIQWAAICLLLTLATWVGHHYQQVLSTTGVVMMYLLVVVVAAYFFEIALALISVGAAFVAINYFFIAPTYTFQVGSVASWASLISFLVVAVVIASLVKRLQSQTALFMAASKHAEFARKLSERLAVMDDLQLLAQEACELLSGQYHMAFQVVGAQHALTDVLQGPDPHALAWVTSTGQTIGPFTQNWPESRYWLIPFSRLPSTLPSMWIAHEQLPDVAALNKSTLAAIQSHVEQVSQAYQRVQHHARAKQAEWQAQQEAMQNALLASISHDMRTPLTAILGASTALQQFPLIQQDKQISHLATMIATQATYLSTTTENILSLIRLEASTPLSIPMDWQSPEEIIGIVMTHYQQRGEALNIQTRIDVSDALFKANAHLLTQALINLVDNAKQASTVDAPIVLEVSAEDAWLDVSVIDQGPGFAAGFEVTQIKKFSTKRAHGLGLGLPIVQLIAKLHEAQLIIENHPADSSQSGARVTLRFQRMRFEA